MAPRAGNLEERWAGKSSKPRLPVSVIDRKLFHKNGCKKSCFFVIGSITTSSPIVLLAEGYATSATIHEATGLPVVCCFDAGNLRHVAIAWQRRLQDTHIIICADNDRHRDSNVGLEKAMEAARAIKNATHVVPRFSNPDSAGTDWNDLMIEEGIQAVRQQCDAATNVMTADPVKQIAAAIPDHIKSAIHAKEGDRRYG
jgi:phage/plasmid primase-like uncharacterized protein